jgi:hypothetical protein
MRLSSVEAAFRLGLLVLETILTPGPISVSHFISRSPTLQHWAISIGKPACKVTQHQFIPHHRVRSGRELARGLSLMKRLEPYLDHCKTQ